MIHGVDRQQVGTSADLITGEDNQQLLEQTSQQYQQPLQQQRPSKSIDQNAVFLRAARAGNLDQVLEYLRSGIDINACNSNGLNALHLASKEGHNDVVRELIRRGAIVDAATRKGNTALHIASLAGQDVIVTILIDNGADVNAQSLNGFTPLYMAAQENHETVVRYLLANGANQALATEDGFTPLAVALQQGHDRIVALLLENDNTTKVKLPALHIAAKKDDVRAATLLLHNEQSPDVTSKSGFTPLHIAAHYGNESIAKLLLDKGATVNFQARHNISPLHVAAKWGRPNLVDLLLGRGAIIDCRTRDLLTPLHCAARSGHEQVVDLLLNKAAPIGAKTKNGLAPLHMAAQGNHVNCARILLYRNAEVNEVTVDYLTPLHVAAHCGHVEVAKHLLDRNERCADPSARALNGFTPLHIACKKNKIKMVELLLKYHASIEATTESGLTPLHVASFMGNINIVILLLQQKANINCETVRGETPLHLAVRANQTDIVRILVKSKANVDATAREFQTPLHIASRLGNSEIVRILLDAGADPNAATKDQYTPLHIAAKEGQEEVAQLLLDRKANKTSLTRKGFSPIHLAAKYANYPIVQLLLDRGTPVDLEGKNMVTPLHVAAHYNNQMVAQLLLERGAHAQAAAKNGYTPLHIASKKDQLEIARSLITYRADPNSESRAGFTPLHLASEEGHVQMASLLIEAGSKVDARAKNGLSPMHLCAQEDRVDVAMELYRNGADLNAQTNAGYTPLHVACHFGQMNMVRFLVENGVQVSLETTAGYTPLHQAAQQGHNHVVRYLIEHGASPNTKTTAGQTPLTIAQRLGYVAVVETLKTITETTVITETTTVTEERYRPQNPEAMNEAMFSDSEDEVDDHQAATHDHARDFNESITQGLRDSDMVHLMTGEQMKTSLPNDSTDVDLEALIRRAQNEPITTAIPDSTYLFENGHDDNEEVASPRDLIQPSFLISFIVDARGGAMRGCRHSGVRVIIPPRKAAAPIRITCRYLKKEKLSHPPPLCEGEALASRILEMGPHGAKFLGPVILEVPHFASLRGREREIVILRSDDGQHWREHQLEATEDAVQEVLNESFNPSELLQLDELKTPRITRILTNDFPIYFAVVTRVRQEVHCVGAEGGVILSSVDQGVQAIFPDGSLTKTIKVSLQAHPVPNEIVKKLLGNRVAVSPIVTVEPRRRKFHKPITLCIPLPQGQKGMLTQFPLVQQQQQAGGAQQSGSQPQQDSPNLRLLCSITGGSAPAQWEDITGTTQLTFVDGQISFTTTVSARFWLMDCQTPNDSAKMAQEIYNEAIAVPYMAKFVVFARLPYPNHGQLRMFCMTDDKEDKTLEKQEHFSEIARSREVEVLANRYQFLEFAGNIVPVTKRSEQLSFMFHPFQENRIAFNAKVRDSDDQEAASTGRVAVMKEPRVRPDSLPPQQPICTLTITLPDYSGPLPNISDEKPMNGHVRPVALVPLNEKYARALHGPLPQQSNIPIELIAKKIGPDWPRLARTLGIPDSDIRQIKKEMNGGTGQEPLAILKIWLWLRRDEANVLEVEQSLRRIGRDDIVWSMNKIGEPEYSLEMGGVGTVGPSDGWHQPTPPKLQQQHAQTVDPKLVVAKQTVEETQPLPATVVETVITRTERYVHHSDDGGVNGTADGAPVVDERTVRQVFRGDQELEDQKVVVERTAVPLNQQESDMLREFNGMVTAGDDAGVHSSPLEQQQEIDAGQSQQDSRQHRQQQQLLFNSREAMIIDGEERRLGDEGIVVGSVVADHRFDGAHDGDGGPTGEDCDGAGNLVLRTTTLVTTHVMDGHIPKTGGSIDGGDDKFPQIQQQIVEEDSSMVALPHRESSPESSGSVVIKQEEEGDEGPAEYLHHQTIQSSGPHPPPIFVDEHHQSTPPRLIRSTDEPIKEEQEDEEEQQLLEQQLKREEGEDGGAPEQMPAGGLESGGRKSETTDDSTTTTTTANNKTDRGSRDRQSSSDADRGGSASFDPAASSLSKSASEAQAGPRTHGEIAEQNESNEEGTCNSDGSQFVLKKSLRTVSTSKSSVSALDEFGKSIHLEQNEEEDESDTISTTTTASVRERIAIFESMKVDDSGGSKFGCKGTIQPLHPKEKAKDEAENFAARVKVEESDETIAVAQSETENIGIQEIRTDDGESESMEREYEMDVQQEPPVIQEAIEFEDVIHPSESSEMVQLGAREAGSSSRHKEFRPDPRAFLSDSEEIVDREADEYEQQMSPKGDLCFVPGDDYFNRQRENDGSECAVTEKEVTIKQLAQQETLPEAVFTSKTTDQGPNQTFTSFKEESEGAFGGAILITPCPLSGTTSKIFDEEKEQKFENRLEKSMEREGTLSSLDTEGSSSVVTVIEGPTSIELNEELEGEKKDWQNQMVEDGGQMNEEFGSTPTSPSDSDKRFKDHNSVKKAVEPFSDYYYHHRDSGRLFPANIEGQQTERKETEEETLRFDGDNDDGSSMSSGQGKHTAQHLQQTHRSPTIEITGPDEEKEQWEIAEADFVPPEMGKMANLDESYESERSESPRIQPKSNIEKTYIQQMADETEVPTKEYTEQKHNENDQLDKIEEKFAESREHEHKRRIDSLVEAEEYIIVDSEDVPMPSEYIIELHEPSMKLVTSSLSADQSVEDLEEEGNELRDQKGNEDKMESNEVMFQDRLSKDDNNESTEIKLQAKRIVDEAIERALEKGEGGREGTFDEGIASRGKFEYEEKEYLEQHQQKQLSTLSAGNFDTNFKYGGQQGTAKEFDKSECNDESGSFPAHIMPELERRIEIEAGEIVKDALQTINDSFSRGYSGQYQFDENQPRQHLIGYPAEEYRREQVVHTDSLIGDSVQNTGWGNGSEQTAGAGGIIEVDEEEEEEEGDDVEIGELTQHFEMDSAGPGGPPSSLLLPALKMQRPKSPIPPSNIGTPPVLKNIKSEWAESGKSTPSEFPHQSTPDAFKMTKSLSEESFKRISMDLLEQQQQGSADEGGADEESGELIGDQPFGDSEDILFGHSALKIEYPLDVADDEPLIQNKAENAPRQQPSGTRESWDFEKEKCSTYGGGGGVAGEGRPPAGTSFSPEKSNKNMMEERSSLHSFGSSLSSSPAKKITTREQESPEENASRNGSLLEFERIEREIRSEDRDIAGGMERNLKRRSPDGSSDRLYPAQTAGGSNSGSVSSLTEFENIEREIQEQVLTKEPEDIMVLSDIREESEAGDEIGEVVHLLEPEDDNDNIGGRLLSEIGIEDRSQKQWQTNISGDVNITVNKVVESKHPMTDSANISSSDPMICSTDSLELANSNTNNKESVQRGSNTSIDSLDQQHPGKGSSPGTVLKTKGTRYRAKRAEKGGDGAGQVHYEDELAERDSLDGDIAQKQMGDEAFETTQTIFETITRGDDGSSERILRRVTTKIQDPIHSRVKFTGTESEDNLKKIIEQRASEIESSDEQGNVTNTTITKSPPPGRN